MPPKKPLKLFSLDRLIRKGVVAVSLKDLILQARNLFNLDNRLQIKIVLEEDGTEIHNDDYLFSLENHTKLIVMDLTDTWVVASLAAQGIKNVSVPDFKEININTIQSINSMCEDGSCNRYFEFHPVKAVFALTLTENRCSHVTIFKAKDCFDPICNWKNEKLIKLFISKSQISYMRWNADGSQLGVCSIDGTLLVWDYPSCDTLLKIQLSTFHLKLDWNPWRMNSFANHVSAEDGDEIIFWNSIADYETANLASKFIPKKTARIGEVIWIKENQVAVEIMLEECSKIEIREIVEGKGKLNSTRRIKKLNCWGNYSGFDYNKSTEYFATGSEETRTVNICSIERENPHYSLQLNKEFVSIALFWLNTEELNAGIASARKSERHMTLMCVLDNKIIVWEPIEKDLNRQKRIACQLPDHLKYSFSPRRHYLALMTTDKEIMVWDTKTWTLLFTSEPRVFQSTETDVSFSWLFGIRSKKNYLKLVVTNGNEIRFFEGFL